MNWYNDIRNRLRLRFQRRKSWKEFEYFDAAWENRVKLMAAFIKPGESVLDLGCGEMTLKKLRPDILYYPVDYTSRNGDTIVCDFNKKEFPNNSVNTCFVSGVMEYVEDYKWFAANITAHCRKLIISYCSTNHFPGELERLQHNWVNHLSDEQFIALFKEHQFSLKERTETATHNQVFVFEKE